jgi:hypothetical protein
MESENIYKISIENFSIKNLDNVHNKLRSKHLFKYIINYSSNDEKMSKILDWYVSKKLYKCVKHYKYIIMRDNLNIFTYMFKNGWRTNETVNISILKYNAKKLLYFLYNLRLFNIYDPNNIYYCCFFGDINFYKYYISLTNTYLRTNLDYAMCAYNGNLKFFKQLEKDKLKGIIYDISNCSVPFFAACGGHYKLLKFSINKNYHKNKLHNSYVNPDISDLIGYIFGKSKLYTEFFINYLYQDEIISIDKMIDFAELSNNLLCYNYLMEYKNNV